MLNISVMVIHLVKFVCKAKSKIWVSAAQKGDSKAQPIWPVDAEVVTQSESPLENDYTVYLFRNKSNLKMMVSTRNRLFQMFIFFNWKSV